MKPTDQLKWIIKAHKEHNEEAIAAASALVSADLLPSAALVELTKISASLMWVDHHIQLAELNDAKRRRAEDGNPQETPS